VSDQNNWNPWFAPLALVSALVLEVVVGFVVLLIGLGVHPTQAQLNNPPPAVTDVSTGLGEACFVAVAIWLASLRGRPWPAQFGMRRPAVGVLKVFLFVAGGYITFLVLAAIWTAIVNTSANEKYLVKDVGATHAGTLGILASVLVLCVIAPFCEEFLFRGFIFGALRNWRGPVLATLITGVLFGAVHAGSAPAVDLVPLAGLGMILCVIRQLTGSIYPGIVMHMLNNSIALVVNASWSFAAFCAVFAASLALLGSLLMLAQRGLREELV
jgi:membrane protease YdiL (CAAX protease family)